MDAKQRAQFINAQGGQTAGGDAAVKICPKCHAEVKGKFCTKCGTKYEAPAKQEEPAKAAEPVKAAEPFKPTEPVKAAEPVNAPVSSSPFAAVAEDTKKEEKKPQAAAPAGRRGMAFQAISQPEPEVPEEESALAKGLPEWNIEPPQVVVRRKRR